MIAPLIVALAGPPETQRDRLERLLDIPHRFVPASETPQRIDALICLRYGREEAARFQPRLLHLAGAGADGIDFTLVRPDCTVCNVFEHEIPVAEYVMAAILNHAIGYPAMLRDFSGEGFARAYVSRRHHGEIHGKTLGLVGYGHIGRLVARRAQAFGMRVHAISRSGHAPGADRADGVTNLRGMLAAADFVVIACPLNDETRGLIGQSELEAMKPSAVLVNVGRGPIVDEDALYEALAAQRIGGATLDVWYHYPTPGEPHGRPSRHPFERLPNVHCTIHSCAWTREMQERRLAFIAANLKRLQLGLPLLNIIHPARE